MKPVLGVNVLYGKLVSSLESATIFEDSFRVTWVAFCAADFDLLSHIYIDILLNQNKFTIILGFLEKKPKYFLLLLQE